MEGHTSTSLPRPGQLLILVLTLRARGTVQDTQSLPNQVKKKAVCKAWRLLKGLDLVEMAGDDMGQIILCRVQNSRHCKAECEIISVLW